MKKIFAMLAAAACLFAVSCGKDDNGSGNGGNTGGGFNPGGGGNTTAEWVDLGLPSGLLWATCNLGANSPEEYGNYYAWGETTTKDVYEWSTYTYCNGSDGQLTKYCSNSSFGYNGFTDNLTTLEAMDDAATVVLGNGARTPTETEWEELMANTTSEWTTLNSVNGRKFTASNGNTLFLPAAGCRYDTELYNAGSYGYYWSSSLFTGNPNHARLYGSDSDHQGMDLTTRDGGLTVRAVRHN